MTLSLQINYTSSLSNQTYACISSQTQDVLNDRNITRLSASRLVQDSNGSIYIIPKTPAEFIGEKVVHPIVHKISSLATNVLTIFHNISFFESLAKDLSYIDFPSEEVLLSCLTTHPLSDEYSRKNGVTDAVAKIFANRGMFKLDVEIEAPTAIARVDDTASISSRKKLVEALIDCGRRNSAY